MDWYQDERKSPSGSTDSKLAVQTLAISFISHRWSLVGLSICLWLFSPFLVVSVRAFDYFEHKFIAENAFKAAKEQFENESVNSNEDDPIKNIEKIFHKRQLMTECDPGILEEILKNEGKESQKKAIKNAREICETLLSVPVTFGDFVALSGDHFEIPDLTLDGDKKDELDEIIEFLQAFNNPFFSEQYDRILATRRHWMNACQWFKETNASVPFRMVSEKQNSLEEKINSVHSELAILRFDFLHAQTNLTKSKSKLLEERIRSLELDLSGLRLELRETQIKLRSSDKNSLEVRINLLASELPPDKNTLKNCFDGLLPTMMDSINGNFLWDWEKVKEKLVKEKLGKVELEELVASKGYEPSRTEFGDFEKLKNYGSLAANNKKHFPTHSWNAYLSLHNRALGKAQEISVAKKRNGSSLFQMGDLKDPQKLASMLRDADYDGDDLLKYIRDQLPLSTRQLLSGYRESIPQSESFQNTLIHELNQLLLKDSFYNEAVKKNPLAEKSRSLIEQNPQGKEQIFRNRLLLEGAFPEEIAKSYESLLLEALLWESFAQHFLHDSFASGHIGSEFGNCLLDWPLPLVCMPTKLLFQHTHDRLNELGLYVESPLPSEDKMKIVDKDSNEKIWFALGDRHLFIPEAQDQRNIIFHFATKSILEVFHATNPSKEALSPKRKETDEEWVQMFPVPYKKHFGSSPLLRVDDLLDPTKLAVRLRVAPDPVSQYLKKQFSDETKGLLDQYDDDNGYNPPSEELLSALILDFNKVVQGNSLYDAPLFKDVLLGTKTENLDGQNPQGQELIFFNRLLLENAYPHEIMKNSNKNVRRHFSLARETILADPKSAKRFDDLVTFKPDLNNRNCTIGDELFNGGSLCERSSDMRVEDLPFEGWKVSATWGPVWGHFDELNTEGKVSKKSNFNDGGSFEVGYVRASASPTNIPLLNLNYFGFGTFILPGTRTSIYPLSVGSWHSPPSRFYFIGWRLNTGIRITEAYQQDNPTNQIRSQMEFNLPIDIGFTLYPPLSFYARLEALSVALKNQSSSTEIESLFIGRGSITFGFSYDLAGIF